MCAHILGGGAKHLIERNSLCRALHSDTAGPEHCTIPVLQGVGQIDVNTLDPNLSSAPIGFIGDQFNLFLGKHDRPLTSLSGDLFLSTHPTASSRTGKDHPSPEN